MASTTFYLVHSSGLYVAPQGGVGCKDSPLVFTPGPKRSNMLFRFENQCMVHVDSGLLVHPQGGHANDNTVLLLHPGGFGENRLYMRFQDGHLVHSTGRLVHPLGGIAHPGTKLCFHQGGHNETRLRFHLEPANEVLLTSRVDVVGFIRHVDSQLVIVPRETPRNNTELILDTNRGGPHELFRFDRQGCLQHVSSGLFVHPSGGTARQDVRLVLHQGGGEGRLRLALLDTFLVHSDTGLLVHPLGGTGKLHVPLVYHPAGRGEQRLRFHFVIVNQAPLHVTPVQPIVIVPSQQIPAPVVIARPMPVQVATPVQVAIPVLGGGKSSGSIGGGVSTGSIGGGVSTGSMVSSAPNPTLSLPPSNNPRGWLKHVSSGLYLMADGFTAAPDKAVVLTHPQYYDSRMIFEWDQGCIRHSASQLYLIVQNGTPGAPVVFGHVLPNPSFAMFLKDNIMFHQASGMMVQVAGGNAYVGARLALGPADINDKRHMFTFEMPDFNGASMSNQSYAIGAPPAYKP